MRVCYYVFLSDEFFFWWKHHRFFTMCSLVMSPFSRDYMKTEIDQIKYQQCFNCFTRAQNSHSAWFLDGRTSILVMFICTVTQLFKAGVNL